MNVWALVSDLSVLVTVRAQMISVRARVKAVRERTVLNTRSRTDSNRSPGSRTVDLRSQTGGVRVWGPTYNYTSVLSTVRITRSRSQRLHV